MVDDPSKSERGGREVLFELRDAMRMIGLGGTPENMERVCRTSSAHCKTIGKIMELLPGVTVRLVMDCVAHAVDPVAGLRSPDADAVREMLTRVGSDPRSYREAGDVLDALAESIVAEGELDRVLGRALMVLDERGVLGRARLFQLARFLIGVERRPDALESCGLTLKVADESLSLLDLSDYEKSLLNHNFLWGAHAASIALYPDTDRFGALAKVGPSSDRTLTVDMPSLALLPSRTLKRRWAKMYPVPASLKHVDPINDIDPYVRLFPIQAWSEPSARTTLEAVYAGVRVALSMVQPLWLARVRLKIRMVDEPGDRACYMPGEKTIYVWRGPLAAWSVVHEMAHALDDLLYPGPGLASEQPGSPLNSFVAVARPYYRDIVEKRARTRWNGLLDVGLSEPIRRRLRHGSVPVDEVLEGLTWLSVEERPRVRDLLFEDDPLDRTALIRVLGPDRSLRTGELPLLSALQAGVIEPGDGAAINLFSGWEAFLHTELSYLLSDREVFARFFDQYCRLYLAQLKASYGPSVHPGDLPAADLASLVPRFHQALVDLQLTDFRHALRFSGRDIESDAILSLGVTAGLVALQMSR